jgi:TRAP-type C4-dicarboxylate transport system substrate-binding protein
MSASKLIAIVAASLALTPGTAPAEPAKIIFATANPPNSALVEHVFKPWVARVNAASPDTIDIEIREGTSIANLTNYYDRVMNDVVQIVFGMQGLIGGRFPLSAAAGLPYVADDGVTASVAFWRLYKSGMLDAEYKELKPVMLAVLPQSRLHLNRVPKTIEETAGMKLIASGKERSEVVSRLGYAPITGSSADMYPMLQRHVADGIVSAWPAFETFKLAEVTAYHLDVPLGGSTSIVFLSAKRFAALPEAAQKTIDANSNEAQSRQFGVVWEQMATDARNSAQKAPGHVFAKLPPDTAEKWRRAAEPVLQDWARAQPGGEAVLAKFRTLLAEVQAGK